MAEKNIKNTHPNNLGILQFWILHLDFCILLQAAHPAVACFRFLPSLYSSLPFLCLVLFTPSCLCVLVAKTRTLQLSSVLYKSPLFMQNKPNFKIGKMNISTATLMAYANKQRTMNNERYSKQTQSKPISNAETPYSACRTRDCHGPAGLAMTGGNSAIPPWERLPRVAITCGVGVTEGETRAGSPCHDVRATGMPAGQVVSRGFF